MTRAEAEASVRTIGRICKGPWLDSFKSGLTLSGGTKVSDLGKPRDATITALQKGDAALAVKLEAFGRGICGIDFNDTICAGLFDGQVHKYTCPRCGNTGTYTAPYFGVSVDKLDPATLNPIPKV